MADTAIAITAGSGTNVDTRTEGTNGNHRQVIVIGDPATNAGVAPVDATKGLAVDLSATGANTNKLLVTPDLPTGASTAAKQPALGTAGSASTDVITVQGISSMTKLLVTPDLPSGASTAANQTTGNTSLGNIDTNAGATSDAAITAGATGSIAAKLRSISRDLVANIVLAAGTNKIGDVDIAPRTTGGWSVGNFTSGDSFTALTSTAQVCKASAGKFGGYYVYNPNAVTSYVIVYDVAQGSVTVGTTNPKLVFAIPAYSAANLEILAGIPFGTAITVAATTTGGGNTAPTTALECMIWYV